jgi:hypothetical protein
VYIPRALGQFVIIYALEDFNVSATRTYAPSINLIIAHHVSLIEVPMIVLEASPRVDVVWRQQIEGKDSIERIAGVSPF